MKKRKLIEIAEKKINESSLSRLWRKNEEYDTGVITAFRQYDNCGYIDDEKKEWCPGEDDPKPVTRKENKKRNLALASDLIGMGYKITKVIGKYMEGGGKPVTEVSYFVEDVDDKGTLKKDLIKLGEKYGQDSILYMPKGSMSDKSKAMYVSTNNCCNNWVGKKYAEKPFDKVRIGRDNKEFGTYIHGRPFFFESVAQLQSIFQSMSNAVMAKSFAKEYEKKFLERKEKESKE